MNLSDIQTSLMYHREKGRRRKQQLWASLVVLKNSLTVPYTSSQHSCFVRDRPAQKPFLSLMFGAIASAWNSAWYFISALIRIFSFDRCWNLSIDKYFGWRIEDGWTEEDGWRTEDDDHVCSLGSPSLLFFIVSVVIIIGLVLTIFTMLGRSAHILQMEWERETETDRQREAETDRQTDRELASQPDRLRQKAEQKENSDKCRDQKEKIWHDERKTWKSRDQEKTLT